MIAIVTVGYNRVDSLSRLLDSVCNAEYNNDRVDLVISLDKSDNQNELVDLANSIQWENGRKIIRAFSERQGLRPHILQCGDLTSKYDAVVILEDDLIVSKFFYSYVKQSIDFYKNDSRIAGISLYKLLLHQGVHRPFEPANNGYDVFFMQVAQSWGQCWTKEMWADFKHWYTKNENIDLSQGNLLPTYIAKWDSHSWLKYYMRYIVETDKFFVYPQVSLTSNCSDVGQHRNNSVNDYQVPLLEGNIAYRFAKFEEAVKYDIHFERLGIDKLLFEKFQGRVLLDLYGNRTDYSNADFVLSVANLPFKIIAQYGLTKRPIEANVFSLERGEGLYLYDTKKNAKNKVNANLLTRYDVKDISWKRLLRLGMQEFIEAVRHRILRKLKQ